VVLADASSPTYPERTNATALSGEVIPVICARASWRDPILAELSHIRLEHRDSRNDIVFRATPS
jgi:hypothetical protein